jgi:RsmE family RNA methyltransferase
VNLILFEPGEITAPLPRRDPRATHILDVLRRSVGDTFDVGIVNGARGKATVLGIDAESMTLQYAWTGEPVQLDPIILIVGLPRPQTARKVLQEATSLGVAALHFVTTARTEPAYGSSVLWKTGEWRRHLVAGAEQAFCTRLPEVSHGRTFSEVLESLPNSGTRVALDNYESDLALGNLKDVTAPFAVAVGAERGWSPSERDLLRGRGFVLTHLGSRVLRVETACVAALAVLKARAGFW